MSGVFKAVGKVFKKVAFGVAGLIKPVRKVLKKVLLPALAIGAVVLTGGAALGVLPAVSSVVGGLGLSAGLTTALSGAVTGAGWGGLLGGITGGKKGLLSGALLGGITGGLGGALSGGAGALPSASSVGSTIASDGASLAAQNLAQSGLAASGAVPAAASAGVGGGIGGGIVAAGGSGGVGGMLGGNSLLLPSILQGVGGALQSQSQSKSVIKQMREQEAIDQRAREARAANYRVGGGLLTQADVPANDRQSPEDRFNPSYYDPVAPRWQYVYDESLGRVVKQAVN